ncbi:lipase [Fodinicola feengrottensis]|uniref:Lipase n=1 Tax=Fodinicola feengrottensis TaxID=435914 RepID=A0ABN2GS35_9ACTN
MLAVVVMAVAGYLYWPVPDQPEMKTKFIAAPQDQLGPVLIVPGFGGDVSVLTRLADRIRDTGRTVQVLSLPDNGRGDLRVQAQLVAAAASKLRGKAPSIDVIGYSAGGVAARLWLKDYGGAAVTRRVVTIGSPNHGTQLAGLAFAVAADSCPTACQQLADHSRLITALNSPTETPPGPLWTTMWTKVDDTVVPASSGQLRGAVNTELQSVCADDTVRHTQLPNDPLVIGIVLGSIALDPPIKPTAPDCNHLREAAAFDS